MTSINVAELSLQDLAALQAQIRAQKSAIQDAQNAHYAALGTDLVEDVVTSREPEQSEKSAWVGYSERFPVTVDDTLYQVTVTITDVKAKEARAPQFKKETADATA